MFALPGICGLIIFILARPQEFYEPLQRLPLLYLFCAAAIGGLVLDMKLRRLEPMAAPTLPWAVGFFLWALVCNAVKIPDQFVAHLIELIILMTLFVCISHAVQRFRALHLVAGTVMVTCLFLSFVCWHQGMQPRSCVLTDDLHPGEGTPDGRPCVLGDECYGPEAEPGAEYECEKVGLFGTYSVEDRVRYRGELHDPNELGMTICIGGLAFLIAFARHKRSLFWIALALVGGGMIFWTILLSQSRGALLVYLAVPGVYFVKKYGLPAVAVGGVVAMAALALGGRSGDAADASTQLRYEAWAAGLTMFKSSPIFGVGHRMFSENHFMAAHNTYVLAFAELGIVGFWLFIGILYMSVKTLILGVRELEAVPGARIGRIWGMALLSSYAGMLFQINTLSFAYHTVLWVFLGLSGAYALTVRHHRPEFRVRATPRDLLAISTIAVMYAFVVLPIFLRWKHAM